jgi:hypothetical protein
VLDLVERISCEQEVDFTLSFFLSLSRLFPTRVPDGRNVGRAEAGLPDATVAECPHHGLWHGSDLKRWGSGTRVSF